MIFLRGVSKDVNSLIVSEIDKNIKPYAVKVIYNFEKSNRRGRRKFVNLSISQWGNETAGELIGEFGNEMQRKKLGKYRRIASAAKPLRSLRRCGSKMNNKTAWISEANLCQSILIRVICGQKSLKPNHLRPKHLKPNHYFALNDNGIFTPALITGTALP